MAEAWKLDPDEARRAVEHSMTGALVYLEESVRELGRVIVRQARADRDRLVGWFRR
jgi:hypothetical protein